MQKNTPAPTLLSGFTPEQTRIVLQSAERRKFRAGHVIVNSGDLAANLFQLAKGRAKYYRITKKGDEVLLWWLATGDIFGIGTLLGSPRRYVGTAEAVDDCEVLVWSRKKIRSLAAGDQRLVENVLGIVMHYLAAYADRIVGLTTETAEQRLARTLIQLADRNKQVRSGAVEIAITNGDLGRLANVSPFTTSRLLNTWERQGILEKSRGKIRILSPEGLLMDDLLGSRE